MSIGPSVRDRQYGTEDRPPQRHRAALRYVSERCPRAGVSRSETPFGLPWL